jgi:hypothetical protein
LYCLDGVTYPLYIGVGYIGPVGPSHAMGMNKFSWN